MDSAEYEAFTIKQQVLDFAGITSLHAIPYVISTNRRIVQVRGHEWSSYKQNYLFVILYRALVLFYSFIISAVLGGSFHCSTLLSFQLFWVVVFIAATIGCGFHLSSISHTFLARDTTTSINLGYAPLAFPSVTFCNMNPLRHSKDSLLTAELRRLRQSFTPEISYKDEDIDAHRKVHV